MLRPSCLFAVLAAGGTAFAHPFSIVPGGQDPEPGAEEAQKSVDVFGELDYSYELESSTLLRERIGPGSDPDAGIPLRRDLDFKQFKHTVTPRLQVGVFRDTFVYGALPIVITQVRELTLAPDVGRASSSSVIDGILPADGYDARDPGTPTTGNLMFRGPTRHGLDQIHLGLGVAPMNQMKDPTKPTWKIGAEVRLAIGEIMKFDPMRPDGNHGVSHGVQELKFWTSFARKLGRVEPWIDVFWQVPLTARDGSLYTDPGFGATNTLEGQQAGFSGGLELYAVEQPAEQTRISIDLGTQVIAHFEGRQYSEMWEAFAAAGDSRGMGPLILDSDPTRDGIQASSHPGITNIENYLETKGRFALRGQIGHHVRFAVTGDVIWKTDHAITFADAGVDFPTCGSGKSPCEKDSNDLVNPGTAEVNPLHAPLIDLVGHRYISADNFAMAIAVLPRSNLAAIVDVMQSSERLAGLLVAEDLDTRELSAVATRVMAGDIFGLDKIASWGTRVHVQLVGDYQEKARCIEQASAFAETMGVRRKYREAIDQCLDEMLMNGLYDAPIDEQGRPLFPDMETRSQASLPPEQKVVVQYACDGTRFAVGVRDAFGTLERSTVLRYLHKCLHNEQQIDRKAGGAGLGLYLMASSASTLYFNVLPGVATEAICVFELDAAKVQLRQFGFFHERVDTAGRLANKAPVVSSHPVERRRVANAPEQRRLLIVLLSALIVVTLALIAVAAWQRLQ